MKGVILYGPPAAGKDTVTRALTDADPRCQLFARLKVGQGKTSTYRMTTRQHLDDLRAAGALAWENTRYGATYAVDTPELLAVMRTAVPVLHLGQTEAINAIRTATPDATWLVIHLWCPRAVAETRLRDRNPDDVAERLAVWDATPTPPTVDLTLNTAETPAPSAARAILSALPPPLPG